MKQIDFRINKATVKELIDHLKRCESQFIPPLTSYVDIEQYSYKIRQHAVTVEAYSLGCLIGLIAVYYNEGNGFITNVSIEQQHNGQGIATKLLLLCLDLGKYLGYKMVELEVYITNDRAAFFYKKNGFREVKRTDSKILMIKEL